MEVFQFSIGSKLDIEITTELVEIFKQRLEEIIVFCINKEVVEYINSDFINVESESDLSGLPLIAGSNQYDWFEMTDIQKAYLLGRLANYEIGNVSNHIYGEFYYKTLNVIKLENVLNLLIEKYDVLRTVYSYERLQQKFLKFKDISMYKILVNDYSGIPLNNKNLKSIRNRLSHKVYNPEQFPLFTFEVTKFQDCHVLHISIDLILLDAQSRESFFTIIDRLYRDDNFQVNIPSISFKDYQDYYQLLKHSAWYRRDKEYWHKKIANMPLRPELPFKVQPETIQHPTFTDHTLYIERGVWIKFKDKAQKYNLSYSSILLSLYGSVISYFSGYKEFIITMTVFNRYSIHKEVKEIWGDFTSTNLFHYIDETSLIKTLRRTHNIMWEDIHHALYSGLEVQREVAKLNRLDSNKAVSPIVFTGVVGNKSDPTEETGFLEDNELIEKGYWAAQTSQAWIDLQAVEIGDKFMSKWLYVEQLFDQNYIEELNKLYCNLITFLAEYDWEDKVNLFNLPIQDRKLVEAANNYKQEYSSDTIVSRYERTITEYSTQNNIAVLDGATGKKYSYIYLIRETDLLSRYIIRRIEQQNLLIGVLSEKGYNQVVSTLAIMKSGHGYLPLNVEWPVGRLDEILEEGGVKILLISKAQYTQEQIRQELSKKYNLLVIEDILSEIHNKYMQSELAKINLPVVDMNDIAYVIFTSGSTGKPKGVTISHRGALNTIDAVNNRYNVTSKDKILALSELSFDLSVYDIFGILAVGGTIVFPAQDSIRDPKNWLSLVEQNHITIWNTVPQLASLLIDELESNILYTHYIGQLKLFLLSGDWIPVNLSNRIRRYYRSTNIVSLGGATEGSIWSVWYEINEMKKEWSSVPYGVAMPNQKIYVLNHNGDHCPVGVIGEIYIGGFGVALNYWNNKELTDGSFIEHSKLNRLYKTGDLGKWNSNGYLEFIGRKDNQVKLNGYRVELGEISAKLMKLNGIDNAIVQIQNKDNRNYLVGYLSPSDHKVQSKTQTAINKDTFQLEQHGLIQNLEAQYSVKPNLQETQYRLRKSYRQFLDLDIRVNDLVNAVNNITLSFELLDSKPKAKINKTVLISTLGVISGIRFIDRALPKYRYPSAGSSYGIRCFVSVAAGLKGINPGYYYYNPVEYTLCRFGNNWKMSNLEGALCHELHMIVNWASIKPLYGELAKKFSYIEAGHMLSLLMEELDKNNIGYRTEIVEEDLDDDNTMLVKLILNSDRRYLPELDIAINYLHNDKHKQSYVSTVGNQYFDLKNQSVFTKASEFGQLLNTGNWLIVLEGHESKKHWILSGLLSQRITEKLYSQDIGSCSLGFVPYEGALYALILGGIDKNDKYSLESRVLVPSLKQVVNHELSKDLPEYMLPIYYEMLEEIPLNANGKLDVSKLPELTVQAHISIPPSNELEKNMCEILAEVLGLDVLKLGINDDFFSLGGNSVLAIKFVSKLNNYYQSCLKIADIFIYKNIESLLDRIVQTKNIYQAIIKLNNTYHKPNMFMIHPGAGGCEVYASLANALTDNFSCYGVDSYNLYQENKIDNLHNLAQYYLAHIDKIMLATGQKDYYLLGWSLGGQISLEIASILENRDTHSKKPSYKIKVFLLDTILRDKYVLSSINDFVVMDQIKNQHIEHMKLKGFDELYIKRMMLCMEIEEILVKQGITTPLKYTKVLLFKAMMEDPGLKNVEYVYKYPTSKYNNIDRVIKNKCNIELIRVNNAHHGNILSINLLPLDLICL